MARVTTYRRALITGASRGIGEAFARRLAAAGTNVVLVARDAERLAQLARALRAVNDVDAEVLTADLTRPADRTTVEARLDDGSTPVDLLVNNAGSGLYGPFADHDVDAEAAAVELDVVAPVRLAHAAARAMSRRRGGAIVNLSSITAFQPVPDGAVYAASKAFVLRFSEALHEELARDHVRVMALCPGFTRTDIFTASGADEAGIPRPLWRTADEVVADALADLDAGRAVSVPGLVYRAQTTIAPRLPRALARRAAGFLARRL